jgi:hypothetical protein
MRIISFFILLFGFNLNAQQFTTNNGYISFFSEAPLEDITAVNNNVRSIYDMSTDDIVFELDIKDFIFSKSLMQAHFNENYLESDIYPTSIFAGKLTHKDDKNVIVEGYLTIHGKRQLINVNGIISKSDNSIFMQSSFNIKLDDYDIDIPKIVMYKIAEDIMINVKLELNQIK